MEPAVSCSRLSRRYGATEAVSGLDLEVAPGEVFGLLGPDGAGKTTTMRMLTGIVTPTSGSVQVLGRDMARDSEAVKPRIGYMSQRFSLYSDMTVMENLVFFADLYQVAPADRQERISDLLDAARMSPFRNRQAQHLSGGMKQKLALSCALIHTPEILFLDEPTTGVDPISRRDFWAILYGLVAGGMTMVVSTPYMDEAERCGRIGLMHRGRMLLTGKPSDLGQRPLGPVFSVTGCEPRAARAALAPCPRVKRVDAFGDRTHVVGASGATEADMAAALAAAGLAGARIEAVETTLEDLFVSLIEEADHA